MEERHSERQSEFLLVSQAPSPRMNPSAHGSGSRQGRLQTEVG